MAVRDARLAIALWAFLVAVTLLPWLARHSGEATVAAGGPGGDALEQELRRIFAVRAQALVGDGQPARVEALYDTASRLGRWALEREERKIRYVHTWAARRGVQIAAAETALRVRRVERKGDTAWVELVQTLGLDYVYPQAAPGRVNRIGIGTRHVLQLVRRGGRWLIRRDWFTDPLGEDAVVPDVTPACGPADPALMAQGPLANGDGEAGPGEPAVPARYRREAAVAYADRYCGAARGCGNGGRYNPRYRDYTLAGGDCTNFVSQVLGDREGGALPMDAVWYADYARGGVGSRAWVQGGALVDHLLATGRAGLLARGTFAEVTRARPSAPQGAVGALQPGDLIAYQEKARVEHLAVVVGVDSRGYPVVDSHTADRYHVPWDLGWDRTTVFWLLHLRDAPER